MIGWNRLRRGIAVLNFIISCQASLFHELQISRGLQFGGGAHVESEVLAVVAKWTVTVSCVRILGGGQAGPGRFGAGDRAE